MISTREAWEDQARAILRPHLGHTAVLQGWHHITITEHRLRPANIAWVFAGFAAHCQTCGVSLSQQWNS